MHTTRAAKQLGGSRGNCRKSVGVGVAGVGVAELAGLAGGDALEGLLGHDDALARERAQVPVVVHEAVLGYAPLCKPAKLRKVEEVSWIWDPAARW